MENLDKRLKNSSQKNNLKKIRVIKSDKLREELLNDFYKYLKYKNILEVKDVKEADLIISFGGDGTMLVASKEAIKKDVPIMAVNMGTLGYLAEINPENAIEMLEKYQNGEYIIDNRNFLKVKYNNKKYYALNCLMQTINLSEGSPIYIHPYQ